MKPTTRKQTRRTAVNALMILVGLLLLIVIFRGTASRLFAVLQRPLVGIGTWITVHTTVPLGAATDLGARIKELESERNSLALDYAELERLREENDQLRKQLSFTSRRSETFVSAAIVSRSSTNRTATFVIDRGERDGIALGSPVIVGEGYLVGKVTALMSTTATVTATTDANMATAATLLNEGRTIGIAQGSRGRLITLSFIPHGETINVNDLVVTSGLEDGVPSGLLIGIVNTVKDDPNLPFQDAVVEPLVDIGRYRIVSVLTKEAL